MITILAEYFFSPFTVSASFLLSAWKWFHCDELNEFAVFLFKCAKHQKGDKEICIQYCDWLLAYYNLAVVRFSYEMVSFSLQL